MRISLAAGMAVALLTPCAGIAQAQSAAADFGRKPVVVELFTSEGCSSCPPADALLQKLAAQQPISGAEIIPIEEHVDYWNHDGWVDPYSSARWTERQQSYTRLQQGDPYTPEMVIDGRTQFVGNNEQRAQDEIRKAAGIQKTEVAIEPLASQKKGSLRFKVSVGEIGSDNGGTAEVWLALTEDGLHSTVSRGENSGRVLQHVATLRSLQKIGVAKARGSSSSFAEEVAVKCDAHWAADKLTASVFVQRENNRQILGAAAVKVNNQTSAAHTTY